MNAGHYTLAFLPASKEFDVEELKTLLRDALSGTSFEVEINDAMDDESANEALADFKSLLPPDSDLEAEGLTADLIGKDLLMLIDDYPVLVAITEGEDANELASAYDETEGLTEAQLELLEATRCCVELYAEEEDPQSKYLPLLSVIAEKMRQDWKAVVIEGEVID